MFKRIVNLVSGMLSSILRMFESQNPLALIESEKTNLRNKIVKFNEGLAEQAGLVYKLTKDLQENKEEEKNLNDRILTFIKAGDQANAAKLALKLSLKKKAITETTAKCINAEKTFRNLENIRNRAIADTSARIRKFESLVSQTEIVSAQNELMELAGNLNVALGTSFNSLEVTCEMIEHSHNKAIGRSRVLQGESNRLLNELYLQESEEKILQDKALADFISSNAIESNTLQNSANKSLLAKYE